MLRQARAAAGLDAAPLLRDADRAVKAAVIGTVSTAATLVGHVAAGGSAPSALGLAAAIALSFVLGLPLAQRAVSVTRLTIIVVLGQIAFHLVFSAEAALTASATASAMHAGHAGHDGGHHGHTSHSPVLMAVAHAVTAVLLIALSHAGERTIERVAAAALAGLRQLARVAALVEAPMRPSDTRRPLVASTAPTARPQLAELAPTLSRRGPPARLV